MASREDTIKRVRKLMELAANNPNEAEATAAALQAQRLIARHDVQDYELMDKGEDVIKQIESGNYNGNPWAVQLGSAIADNFRCRMYTSWSGYKSWTGRTRKTHQCIVFMGYETDAEAAATTFDRLFEIGNKLAGAEVRRARDLNGTARGVKNSFLMGFVKGIRNELEKQATALVLVRPKAVNDYADEVTSGFKKKTTTVRNTYDSDSFNRGQAAGHDAMRATQLGSGKRMALVA